MSTVNLMSNKIDKIWVFAILFINGWNWALPVTSAKIPIWFTPIQVVHGVFSHEIVFSLYILYILNKKRGRIPIEKNALSKKIAFLIILLGFLGVISNCVNLQPIKEMGEALRFFLLALLFLLITNWVKEHGEIFVFESLLLGTVCAGIVNIYYSFNIRFNELGGLPFLLGQKGPGGSLGITVIISAWIMLERKEKRDAIIAVSFAIVGIFAASISYSKLAMIMAGLGIVAWGSVVSMGLLKRKSRRTIIVMLVLLIGIAIANYKRIGRYMEGVYAFTDKKFIRMHEGAVVSRSHYIITTMEVMSNNPLFGVGYAGFYEAVIQTSSYSDPESSVENRYSGKKGLSNPHNAFLYYASANGLPGLITSIVLFFSLIGAFLKYFRDKGSRGKVIFSCLSMAYLVYGMAVPSLFNTAIMYFPAAIAIASKSRKYYRLPQSETHLPNQY